jgi:hypothetical protein
MKLAIHGEALWQMRQDGHLCGPTVQEARCYDLFQEEDGFQVNTLVADEYGVWVGTSRGAYRILSSQ